MKIQFHIDLPARNLQRVGGDFAGYEVYDRGFVRPAVDGAGIQGRSVRGYKDRELNRFFPVILLLEAQAKINQWQMRRYNFRPLYESGVFYQAEEPGCEDWLDTPTLYAQGFGDCEDIACTLAAEKRERHGIAAVPCIKFKDFVVDGKLITLIHVLVLNPDGVVEDPSKALGMKGEYQ